MTSKNRDMLVGLLAIFVVAVALKLLLPTRQMFDWIGRIGASGDSGEAERSGSFITSGQPPVLTLPQAATPAKGDGQNYWITNEDYPGEALRNDWQGRVSMSWVIETDGRVRKCYILESSGHDALDEAACRAIVLRGRYEPARDAKGVAIRSQDMRRVVWRLPDSPSGE